MYVKCIYICVCVCVCAIKTQSHFHGPFICYKYCKVNTPNGGAPV